MALSQFNVTPEKEASFLSFLSRQWNTIPKPVTDVDLTGKTAVIVGATSGVGIEAARQLLNLGLHKLIIGARDTSKATATVASLQNTCGKVASIEVWPVDLASYDSVASFARRAETLDRMDHVLLNAGICATSFRRSEATGHEETVQTNYLSLALLTTLLLPAAAAKRRGAQGGHPTRITLTSSDVAAWTSFKERSRVPLLPALDEGVENLTDRMMVSKLLGQFYVAELAKRLSSDIVTINCVTPGMVRGTEFNREVDKTFAGKMVKPILRFLGYPADLGARNIVDAAIHHDNEATHGQYLSAQRLKPMAPIIYTEEGLRISAQLWKETMDEFAFVDAEHIIENLRE